MLILTLALFLAVELAQGNISDKPWVLFPGEDGTPHVAFLRGGLSIAQHFYEPYTIDEGLIIFQFYSKASPNEPITIDMNDLKSIPFDPAKDTKIIVHGYASNCNATWITQMKDELLTHDDCQVIVVDWSQLATPPLYYRAAKSTPVVGRKLGFLLSSLKTDCNANAASFHVIGFSLGAHVAGLSGKTLTLKTAEQLGRITGLDPAQPLMYETVEDAKDSLHKSDASFVDIIHTCSGWLGYSYSIGHADFYPNGGVTSQPGCGVDYSGTCSHTRAIEYYIESISSTSITQFNAVLCPTQSDFENFLCGSEARVNMGDKLDHSARGDYYLVTASDKPYALG